MASKKRGPTSNLNHNNWDQEEEPEEAGHFKEADENELKTRVIKKARRRIGDQNADDAPKSIFGGFTGFTKTTSAAAPAPADSTNKTSSLFSFLNKLPAAAAAAGNATNAASSSQQSNSFSSASIAPITTTPTNTLVKREDSEAAYHAKIIKLNQTFCNWIKTHVDKEPICNLMSTFKDYEKYWEQLKAENSTAIKSPSSSSTTTATLATPAVSSTTTATSSIFGNIKFNSPTPTTASTINFGATSTSMIIKDEDDNKNMSFGNAKSPNGSSTSSPFKISTNGGSGAGESVKPSFSFGLNTAEKATTNSITATTSAASGFSFGLKNDATVAATSTSTAPTTTFSFGQKTNATDKPLSTAGFSFSAGSAPFSFGNIKPPAAIDASNDNKDGDDDEDDAPPKVEVKEIVEEDAFYNKKCKVFLKKDNAYKDFGLAMLYMKPVQGSPKTQLLVRSSPLGKIVINTLLAEATPVQRVGKNNVMIIYPNADGENQTNLIRVKDASEADDLLETINKHKK